MSEEPGSNIKTMFSYGVGKFNAEFLAQAFGVVVFKYYETEVHLAGWLTALALIIYSLYNALNDPLIGYFTEKKTTRLTQKMGRRFPWIIIGLFIWVFTFILIFAIPDFILSDQKLLFGWMVLTTCLFDTFYSLWDVNYQSLFPDKFRSESVRSKAAGIATVIGIIGIASGFILPSIVTVYGVPQSYVTTSIIVAIVGFFAIFLMIPGVKETPDMIGRYFEDRKKSEGATSFFTEMIQMFKVRNYVAWIVLYFFYQSAVNSMTGSVQYIGHYIIGASTTLIFVGLLIGAIIGIPIWLYSFKIFGDRVTNQTVMMMTAILMALFALPMVLPIIDSSLEFTILIFLFGLAFGGYWMIMTPALADVIDEVVVNTGVRNDGIFMGFRAFFGRLAFAVQAISFWLVHEITGFNANVDQQTELAILGIHIHTALIPAMLLLIGVFVFWRINTLDAEKVRKNKQLLLERKL
ncbi:MAG: MFS transporter [Candidatus Hodarchaeales archaeon]